MQYLVLATDFDGTIAHHGRVSESTLSALQRLKDSGRTLMLVTGREMPDLIATFPEFEICDVIVAENGALIHWMREQREEVLGEPMPLAFIEEIQRRGVQPFSQGKVIFATWEPFEKIVLEVIQQFGLESHIIFNKGAVMVLPSGINKATGLQAALKRMQIGASHVVGVGDAENDHAFLDSCAVSVAVANALPTLKDHCDLVMTRDHGGGVEDLIERLLADDLSSLGPRRPRKEMAIQATASPAN